MVLGVSTFFTTHVQADTEQSSTNSPIGTWKGTVRFISGPNNGKIEQVTLHFFADGRLYEETSGPIGTFTGKGFWSLSSAGLVLQFVEHGPNVVIVVVEHTTHLSDRAMTLFGLGGPYTSTFEPLAGSQGTTITEVSRM